MRTLAGLLLMLCATWVAAQPADTLKKIRDSGTIALGYRTQAAPFAFAGTDGRPAGYSVDLCERIVTRLERSLGRKLEIRWVPVTTSDRIAQLLAGAIDLECGTTTVTLGRLEQVEFSRLIFVDGGSFVARAGGPRRLADLAGKTVGVLPGTTTVTRLRAALAARAIDARILELRDESEGIQALVDRRIDAFANDRIALAGRVATTAPAGTALVMAEEDFSFEPYALMMRPDPAMRLAVDRALAGIYRGPELGAVYDRWFGSMGSPAPLLAAMYYLNALEE